MKYMSGQLLPGMCFGNGKRIIIRKRKNNFQQNSIYRLQIKLVFAFTGIICSLAVFLSAAFMKRSNEMIDEKLLCLMESRGKQMEQSVNIYLDKMEVAASFLVYQEGMGDSGESGRIKKELRSWIADEKCSQRFSDFGIVNSDNSTIGKISITTRKMYLEEGIYVGLSKKITNHTGEEGWFVESVGQKGRLYYVKKLDKEKLLTMSICIEEMGQKQDIKIWLADGENTLIYPFRQEKTISYPTINTENIVTIGRCRNGWNVKGCILLKDSQEFRDFTLLAAVTASLFFAGLGLLIIRKILKPVDGMVCNLEEKAAFDLLSGLLNKISFQEMVDKKIQKKDANKIVVFEILDVDNFKLINDNLGHAYGDEVIIRLGQILKQLYGEKVIQGRIGGDEFCIYMEYFQAKQEEVHKRICLDMKILLNTFAEEFKEEYEKYGVSLSLGVIISGGKAYSFEELYQKADCALYDSKRSGKNQYTLYQDS